MSSDGHETDPHNRPVPDFMAGNLLKPKLDSIFEEVEKNLPTIDFEISDVSSEEDVPIFHRNLKTPSDEGAEEDVALWEDDREDVGEEEASWENSLPPEGTMSVACNTMLSELGMPSLPKPKPRPSTSVSCGTDPMPQTERPQIKKNTWVQSEQKKPDSSEQAHDVVSMFMPVTAPKLTSSVESILQRAERGDANLPFPSSNGQSDINRQNERPGLSLIQRLAAMSMDLSGTHLQDVDPETGALKSKFIIMNEEKNMKNRSINDQEKIAVASPSTDTSDFPNLPRSHFPPVRSIEKNGNKERETVYLDLRGFDKNKQKERENFDTVQRILQITKSQVQESSSDSESDNDEEMWHEQRKRIKQSLLQSGKMPSARALSRPIDRSPPRAPTIKTHAQRLAGYLPDAKKAKMESKDMLAGRFIEPADRADSLSAETEAKIQAIEEKERLRKLEISNAIRKQKEQDRQSRLRLGHSLEALKPTTSNRGKHLSGAATPTLFDLEASYEPVPETLPPNLPPDLEVVLLTIHLSSNGEITQHRGCSSKSIDISLGLSASYSCLLAWLLSLVPRDFGFLSGSSPAEEISAPFHVIGMQQMVHDDQFGLYVAVIPTEQVVQASVGRKKKKDQTAFQQLLPRFFSTHSLQSVCPWIQDLISLEVRGPHEDGKEPFVYRPPLPNITAKPLSTFVQINPNAQAAQRILSEPVGFFWQTMEVDGHQHHSLHSQGLCIEEPQTTMALVYKRIYRSTSAMMGIFNRILQEGLDLAGLRLLFPAKSLMQSASETDTDAVTNVGPVLAFALRGAYARGIWLDAIGPSDPVLARKTDPKSLCALYGGESRDECLVFSPRHPSRIHTEISRWFGGRVPKNGVIDVGKGDSQLTTQPPLALVCSTKADIFITMSPLMPVKALGLILATCQRRGYQLHGIRRLYLNQKQATTLGLGSKESTAFAPPSENSLDGSVVDGSLPCRPAVIFLLQKENASHGAASLIEAFMVQLALKNLLRDIQSHLCEPLTSSLLFKATMFNENLLGHLGGDFSKVPDRELSCTPSYISPQLHCNPELEQVVILTLTGHQRMINFGLFLGRILGVVPHHQHQVLSALPGGLELLGIKWLPSLSLLQAKELTPYEVGHKQWKSSVHTLTSEPAVVLALRGVNIFKRLEAFINPPTNPHAIQTSVPLDRLLSPTVQVAFCQAKLFFQDHELMPDDDARHLQAYIPPNSRLSPSNDQTRSKKASKVRPLQHQESIFHSIQSGPRPLTTVLVVKPHVVAKGLNKLMKKICQEGFHLVAMRQLVMNEELALKVVPEDDYENDVLKQLHVDYLLSSPCLVFCLMRENAVHHLLEVLGHEDPVTAKKLNSFAWRAVFGNDAVTNGLYGSTDYKTAVSDVKAFFPDGICCESNVDLAADGISCKVEDGLLDLNHRSVRNVKASDESSHDSQSKKHNTGTGGLDIHPLPSISPLTQTNCILLVPSLLTSPSGRTSRKSPPLVEILDVLLSSSPFGCGLVGARLVNLSAEQAQHCLHCVKAGSFSMVPLLTSDPCLVLALQGDNAVLGFDSLLGSSFDRNSLLNKFGQQILRPHDTLQAEELLTFFFDHLMPASHLKISSV